MKDEFWSDLFNRLDFSVHHTIECVMLWQICGKFERQSGFFSCLKCIKIEYGEKTVKGWANRPQSLNQKCLDKRKQHN